MNIKVEGCGINDQWTLTNGGSYYFNKLFEKDGTVSYTVKISSKEFNSQYFVKHIIVKDEITSLFIRRLAAVSSKSLIKWVNAGVTDLYVQVDVDKKDTAKLREVIKLCSNTNIRVHAWVICLKASSGWDYSVSRQNKVINFINSTMRINGVKGICLDYVRYSGLNTRIVNPNVITNFVKNINDCVKSYNDALVLSACVFAEKNDTIILYGQNYTSLGMYLDVMMPMAYKYEYGETRN